jgi:ATP-dependent helicase HrpB
MLPIHAIRNDLAAALKRSRRIILTAPTGSGKSTQVPQMLLDLGALGDSKVVILQLRQPVVSTASRLENRAAGNRGFPN